MASTISRRSFLIQLFLLTACGARSSQLGSKKLTIGLVSYDEGEQAIEQYARFNDYLSEKTQAFVNLEPAFNESKALERIENQAWSLVFAPSGLAAIAISEEQYLPLFPIEGIKNVRSIIVVRKNSPIQDLNGLNGQTVALGQVGSATGYYLPIFNLYGLTLAEVLFAPTPKRVLELVAQEKATAGALSMKEFNRYRPQINQTEFRVLYTDPHNVPPGSVLISPQVERNLHQSIQKAMSEAPSVIAQEAGFVPNSSVPDYQYVTTVVKRVRQISAHVRDKPAPLF